MLSFKSLTVIASVSVLSFAYPGNNQQMGQQRDQENFQGGFSGDGQNRFGGQEGFGGPNGQNMFGGQSNQMMFPFLRNVTEQARQEYFSIISNSSLTISQIESQSSTWASTYGVSEQYEQFNNNVTSQLEELKQNVTSVLGNLSSVLNSLENILENEDQTISEQRQAVEALQQESPEEVAALFFIASEVSPKPQQAHQGGNRQGGFSGSPRPNFSDFSTSTVSA